MRERNNNVYLNLNYVVLTPGEELVSLMDELPHRHVESSRWKLDGWLFIDSKRQRMDRSRGQMVPLVNLD